jgi:hypothetical protein
MANRNGQRGGFARFFLEGVDRAFLGNRAYDSHRDYWSGQGARQGGIQSGLGAINPLLGLGARLYFNHQNRGLGPLGTRLAELTPATQIPYTQPGQFQLNPTQRLNPSQIVPDDPQATTGYTGGPVQQNRQGPTMGGMAGLSGLASQMGGARGMHSQGGYTGDAARGLFASMTRGGPQYFVPLQDRSYNQ